MDRLVDVEDWRGLVRDYLINEFELKSIERTSQSNNLGKWMLLTNKDKI